MNDVARVLRGQLVVAGTRAGLRRHRDTRGAVVTDQQLRSLAPWAASRQGRPRHRRVAGSVDVERLGGEAVTIPSGGCRGFLRKLRSGRR